MQDKPLWLDKLNNVEKEANDIIEVISPTCLSSTYIRRLILVMIKR